MPDISKPSMFFLISDATPYLTTDYLPDTSFPNKVYPFVQIEANDDDILDTTTQTKDEMVEPKEPKEEEYIEIINPNLLFKDKFRLKYEEHLPLNSF